MSFFFFFTSLKKKEISYSHEWHGHNANKYATLDGMQGSGCGKCS